MTGDELHKLTARLRRAMPRNADVLALCDEVERMLAERSRARFDKTAYQRDYMRAWRKRKAEEARTLNGQWDHPGKSA